MVLVAAYAKENYELYYKEGGGQSLSCKQIHIFSKRRNKYICELICIFNIFLPPRKSHFKYL